MVPEEGDLKTHKHGETYEDQIKMRGEQTLSTRFAQSQDELNLLKKKKKISWDSAF